MSRDGLVGLIGVVVGVAGLAASLYFYLAGQRYRAPTFIDDPDRTLIVARETISRAPLRVLRADGTPVSADVVSVRFYFWNDGNESIRSEHVLSSIRLRLAGRHSNILDYKILRASRAVCAVTLQREGATVLQLGFRILEPGDGITGQIIYEGDRNAQLSATGDIEGARLANTVDVLARRLNFRAMLTPVGLAGTIGVIIVYVVFVAIGRSIAIRSYDASLDERKARLRTLVIWQFTTIFVTIASMLLLVLYVLPQAQQDARRTVARGVPESVLPPLSRGGA